MWRPPAIDFVIARALTPDPAGRFDHVQSMAAELLPALAPRSRSAPMSCAAPVSGRTEVMFLPSASYTDVMPVHPLSRPDEVPEHEAARSTRVSSELDL